MEPVVLATASSSAKVCGHTIMSSSTSPSSSVVSPTNGHGVSKPVKRQRSDSAHSYTAEDNKVAPHEWHPSSWRACPCAQLPVYPDQLSLDLILGQVRKLPPLVNPLEVDELRDVFVDAVAGKCFILQGGDCAERFIDCTPHHINRQMRVLSRMQHILQVGTGMRVVSIGRIAGQFAKPRSSPTQTVDGVHVTAFRGDNVNSIEPTHRVPDPSRLLQGYYHSAATLNHMHNQMAAPSSYMTAEWDIEGDLKGSEISDTEAGIVAAAKTAKQAHVPKIFISHEGLHLPYEEALTRSDSTEKPMCALSAHMLWIGERTRQADHGHVEFFRGVRNPVGIKLGPNVSPTELVSILGRLWPEPASMPGRIALITRLGASAVKSVLPPLVSAIMAAKYPVVWMCDPMHGNTIVLPNGFKSRRYEDVLQEIRDTMEVHAALGGRLHGVHLELTGYSVTECMGGADHIAESDVPTCYETYCDPRLNYRQSIQLAVKLAAMLKRT